VECGLKDKRFFIPQSEIRIPQSQGLRVAYVGTYAEGDYPTVLI
jgi:hypothetical protein